MNPQLKSPCCPFISSTFIDFQEERDYLVKHVFPELQHLCKSKCTYFAPIDLRWGINKNQTQAGRVISLCLDYIKLGAPYFICLLGDRYGYHYDEELGDKNDQQWFSHNLNIAAQEGHEWVLNYKDKSITELEIIGATERLNCSRSFFYIRDSKYLEKKFPNGPNEEERKMYCVENDRAAGKLQALKQRITSTYPVSTFSSPKELGDLLLRDLKQAIEQDYQDCDTMIRLPHLPVAISERIHSLRPDKREMILSHHRFEARCGDSQRLASNDMDLIARLNDHVATIGQPNSKPIVLVTGEQGCGKSTLLARWAQQYSSDVPLVTHYIGCSTYSRDLSHMLENVLLIMGVDEVSGDDQQTVEHTIGRCTIRQWSTLQDNMEHFNRVIREKKFVLAIDCLESLSADSDHTHVLEEFTWLPSVIPDTCRIIITCTTPSDQYGYFTHSYNRKSEERNWVELSMTGIREVSERQALVKKHLETYCKSLDPHQLDMICNRELSYNPMYLVAVANELRVFGVYPEIDSMLGKIVSASTQEELWFNIFIRWCRDYGWSDTGVSGGNSEEPFGWVQDALCFIAMSRRGLTEQEILGSLKTIGYRNNTEVKTADWASFYRAAQDSLIREHTGKFSLAHGFVQKAVLCSVMGGSPEVSMPQSNYTRHQLRRMPSIFRRSHNCYHTKLALYFEEQPIDWRVIEELPWHWSQAHEWSRLYNVVREPRYFHSFRSSTEINQFNTFKIDLFRYWDEIKRHAPDLPSPAATYYEMVRSELLEALRTVEYSPCDHESLESLTMEKLVKAATTHLYESPGVLIKLAKSTWLAGQFLGEMCDYERGTELIKHAKKLCPNRQKALLYQISFSLGNVYYYRVDWEEARKSFSEALKELLSWATPQDEKLEEQCALHNIMVSCLIMLRRLGEAEKILVEAEGKYKKLQNYHKSPGYWMWLFQKSRFLTKKAQKIPLSDLNRSVEREALFTEADTILRDTLNFMMHNYGWRHPLVAQTWQEKGFLYQYVAGNHDEAEDCFLHALEIYSEVLSHDHVLIATCNYHLGMIYEEMRQWQKGLDCFEIALAIRRTKFKRSTWSDILRRIEKCKRRLGQYRARLNEERSNSAPPDPPVTELSEGTESEVTVVTRRPRAEASSRSSFQRFSLHIPSNTPAVIEAEM